MLTMLMNLWRWLTGDPGLPDLPPKLIFERDISSDNHFWMSIIFNPDMEIMYTNGVVTQIMDMDKCMIDNKYQYQPRTEKEIRNFSLIEQNSAVRLSLYRKKNSNNNWIVSSCFLRNKPHSQAIRFNNLSEAYFDEPTVLVANSVPKLNNNLEEDKSAMFIKVLGDMPKKVDFDKESTMQILCKNLSYDKDEELLNYQTMETNNTQMSIFNKIKLPVKIAPQAEHVFDINIKGKFIGKSTEKIEFIFTDITYNVGVNIYVTDPRLVLPSSTGYYKNSEIDMKRMFELQNSTLVPGVCSNRKQQFYHVKIQNWTIPYHLMKCYWTEDGKYNFSRTEVQEKIAKFYPAAFEDLTYQNYKAKFHTLLFMEEIEVSAQIEKYNKERINFERIAEYLVLKIPDLSESRPSLIPGDRLVVTDPPYCHKRLGNPGKYEGIIHKVMADEIWLKFDLEFHKICEHWDYSVSFFLNRTQTRKVHEVLNEVWKKNRLGESFLFPFKDNIEYQTPKLAVTSIGDVSNKNKNLLVQPKVISKIRWFNTNLNNQQKNAIINILKGEARPMPYIIFGPPGTGKTVTLTESIIQVYKEFPKSRLLICAPTNSAVDLLLVKLISTGLFDKTKLKRLLGYNYFISKLPNPDLDDYYALPEVNQSYSGLEYSEIDKYMIFKKDIMKLRIVMITEGSASSLYLMGLKSGTFTHIFVDEAGQSSEPEILLPLSLLDSLKGGQVVLAGDPNQLGPTVHSITAELNGLGQSMLSRLISYPSYMRDLYLFPEHNGFNPKVITYLVKNYRSLPEIVHNFSKLFYDSLLESTKLEDDVHERVFLNKLNENLHWDIKCKGPIVVHGVMGIDSQDPSSPSWFNPQEAFQVMLYVTRLINTGISVDEIGVISPYLAQVAKIKELLRMYHPDTNLPRVGTVEMFQGQEKMVIIISMVRSKSKDGSEKDKKFHLGFLVAKQRTNVTLSRAKALMIIIGDPSTMLCAHEWKYILVQAIDNKNYVGCNVPDMSMSQNSSG